MVFKCKICGGSVVVDSVSGIATCEYCGTKQALPLFTEESERLLYESGNNYLLHSEYDKAENVFNQLLTIKPGAGELYWDLVLCKYGVTYVKDPKTGKYIPTCNRTHYTSVFSDENYKKAIQFSLGEKRALFEEDAKTIDNIQKGIVALCKKEKPFDIFISYKETDANGNRTKDSVKAQQLYEKLTEAGYKVFFSRITLEDKIGTEYEPYIYAALYSSKVMLTICSSKENIEAVWVKNEWSRFLGFRQKDSSKTLIPLYFDMEKGELPEEFALLSSHNMAIDGFEEELLRGIKKLIPLPVMKAKKRKRIRKTIGIVTACICAVAIALTAIFLPGYLQEQKYREDYEKAQELFQKGEYEQAQKEFEALGEYEDAKAMAQKSELQPAYDEAMQLYYDGKYAEATWAFAELGEYEDAAEQKEKAELSWRKSLAKTVRRTGETVSYISTNGAVDNFEINEHGKIVSISVGALYEDGTLDMGLSEEYTDVIQAVDIIESVVLLKSDGSVVMGDQPINGWENIVSIYGEGFQEFSTYKVWLSAIDVNGNLYEYYNEPYYYDEAVFTTTSYNERDFESEHWDDVEEYGYVLHSDGTLYKEGSKTPVLTDVVAYCGDGCVITQSGTIYMLYTSVGNEITKVNNSYGCVYDEWLARMD